MEVQSYNARDTVLGDSFVKMRLHWMSLLRYHRGTSLPSSIGPSPPLPFQGAT